MGSETSGNFGAGRFPVPEPLYDATKLQGASGRISQEGQASPAGGLYYAGNPPAKEIIGLGSYTGSQICRSTELRGERGALEIAGREIFSFYVIESKDEHEVEELVKRLAGTVSDLGHSGKPLVAIVQSRDSKSRAPGAAKNMLAKSLSESYKNLEFCLAYAVGDTIDAGFPRKKC